MTTTAHFHPSVRTHDHVVPARWNNTGGDIRVHLVPAGTPVLVDPTQEEVWTPSFQETTPLCGLGIYSGHWTYEPDSKVSHRCEHCARAYYQETTS